MSFGKIIKKSSPSPFLSLSLYPLPYLSLSLTFESGTVSSSLVQSHYWNGLKSKEKVDEQQGKWTNCKGGNESIALSKAKTAKGKNTGRWRVLFTYGVAETWGYKRIRRLKRYVWFTASERPASALMRRS